MGFIVEVKQLPAGMNWAHRYITFRGVYRGVQDIELVEVNRVVTKQRDGSYTGSKEYNVCRHVVDTCHEAVKNGDPRKYLASAVVVSYSQDDKQRQQVYPRAAEVETKDDQPLPTVFQASNGVWYVTPTEGWSRGTRDSSLACAFIDSGNVPRAFNITAPTKIGVLRKLADSDFELHKQYIQRTCKLADPKDVPQEVKAASTAPTAQEIAAEFFASLPAHKAQELLSGDFNLTTQRLVGDELLSGSQKVRLNRVGGLASFRNLVNPIPRQDILEYERTPVAQSTFRFKTEPLYAASVMKMWLMEQHKADLQAAKEEQETREAEIEKLKREKRREEERNAGL